LASALLVEAGDFAAAADPVGYLRRILLTAERNSRLMAAWQVRPVDVPITLLRASNDAQGAPDLGWSQVLGRPIDVLQVPGDHQSMMQPPSVMTSALCIAARLGPMNGCAT
jgi:thioesterase domain-containing protein